MSKIGYMCAVDYAHELGEAPDGIKVYRDIKDIKHNRSCIKECGLVKVRVEMIEVIEVGDYDEEI